MLALWKGGCVSVRSPEFSGAARRAVLPGGVKYGFRAADRVVVLFDDIGLNERMAVSIDLGRFGPNRPGMLQGGSEIVREAEARAVSAPDAHGIGQVFEVAAGFPATVQHDFRGKNVGGELVLGQPTTSSRDEHHMAV